MSDTLLKRRGDWEPVRELAFSSLTTTYVALGTPFANPGRVLIFQNTTDQDVFISNDGINDKFRLVSGTGQSWDEATNGELMPQATQISVRLTGVAVATVGVISLGEQFT